MPRTIRKALPELGIAVLIAVVGFLIDNPEVAGGAGSLVILQAVRRMLRDQQAKS